jgi:hypothetical protein
MSLLYINGRYIFHYRVLLPKQGSNDNEKEDGNPTMLIYACVDNMTSLDWKDVKLTLVSGSPLSCKQDIYTPR